MIATKADMPNMLQMGRKFHKMSKMPCQFDEDAFSGLLLGLMKSDECALFVSDGGFVGGVLVPAYCDPKWIQALELFWFSESGHGMRLLREFEAWANDIGANEVRMSSIGGLGRAEKIYSKIGYSVAEYSYSRVL